MNIQEALDAPTVFSRHFPSSFYPREAYPGHLTAEERIPADVVSELERRGHIVDRVEAWTPGKPMAIRLDRERGVIAGGVAPKGNIGYGLGWSLVGLTMMATEESSPNLSGVIHMLAIPALYFSRHSGCSSGLGTSATICASPVSTAAWRAATTLGMQRTMWTGTGRNDGWLAKERLSTP
jgi:hypothetical protein